MLIIFFFPKSHGYSTDIPNNQVIHRFFNVIGNEFRAWRNDAKVNQFQTRRRFRRLNSCLGARGVLEAFSHYYPTYEGLDSHHKGVWCREVASQGRAKNRFLSPRVTLVSSSPSAPDSPPSVSVSGVTLQQLCSPEKFPVALSTYLMSPPSTPLMLLVRNLPARPVRFPRFLFLHERSVSWLPCLF